MNTFRLYMCARIKVAKTGMKYIVTVRKTLRNSCTFWEIHFITTLLREIDTSLMSVC